MPKKRTANLKRHQGPSSLASTSASVASSAYSSTSSSSTVNQKLAELRSLPSVESTEKKRLLAEIVNRPSVPPNLRGILGIPETAAPKARAGFRARDRIRTPGPAPPSSWLKTSRGDTSYRGRNAGKGRISGQPSAEYDRPRPPRLFHFAHISSSNHTEGDEKRLTHYVLTTLARAWHMIDEDDLGHLIEIPLHLRIRLLSYLGYYGDVISINALRTLLRGRDEITFLDLSALAGHGSLSIRRLARLFASNDGDSQDTKANNVAETWESVEIMPSLEIFSFSASRFTNLTHLSLSHPPSSASWKDLLGLVRHTSQLTHLSLAHWPRPTLTPNLTTTVVESRHGPNVQAGGSNYYSGIECDYIEPAGLLRQMSAHLLCLRWLDIDGCADWMPALAAILADRSPSPDVGIARNEPVVLTTVRDGWSRSSPTCKTVFTDTWANLSYIRCAQGWVPTRHDLELSPLHTAHSVRKAVIKYLNDKDDEVDASQFSEVDVRKAFIWVDVESAMTDAAAQVNAFCRSRSRKPMVFDFGWRAYSP